MENFFQLKISAPGKIILHGEHSVVYGKPALVAVISAKNNLILTNNNSNNISFHFESFRKGYNVPVDDINNALKKLYKNNNHLISNNENKVEICLKHAEEFVDKNLTNLFDEQYKRTLLAVFYMLFGIFYENKLFNLKKGFDIELTSELDLGAGLGSSAAFAVCFATAFLTLARFEEFKLTKQLNSNWKENISQWAFRSEKIMHGTPSGVDNTICTYGGLILFKKGEPFQTIQFNSTLNILLVNSKVQRSTSKMVLKVSEMHKNFPKIIDNVFNAMEETVKEAITLYKKYSTGDQTVFEKLNQLFCLNNDLLRSIGVSHNNLDKISLIANQQGFSSKLTGAGGGGYMIILLPQNYKNSKEFNHLCENLFSEGFEWKEATIGGKGVTIEMT